MRGIVDLTREDIKTLLPRLGVVLAIPFAGYLAAKPEPQSPSSSDVNPDASGLLAKSSVPDPFIGGKGLKDELSLQKNEDTLANIIHGFSATLSTHEENFGRIQNSNDKEVCPMQNKEISYLMDSINSKLENTKKLEMDQKIAHLSNLVQVLGEQYSLEEEKAFFGDLESPSWINIMEKKLLPLMVQSSLEDYRPGILAPKYSELIGQSKPMMMIEQLTEPAGKVKSTQEIAACKMKSAKELAGFATIHQNTNSNLEQQNLGLIGTLKFARTVASSSSIPNAQKAENLEEPNHLTEVSGHLARMPELQLLRPYLRSELRNYQPCVEKAIESDECENPSLEKQKKAKKRMLGSRSSYQDEKNKRYKDANMQNSSSQASTDKWSSPHFDISSIAEEKFKQLELEYDVQASPDHDQKRCYKELDMETRSSLASADERKNAPFDISSMTKDDNSSQSKNRKLPGLKLFRKFKKPPQGKQNKSKIMPSCDEDPSSRGSSKTEESVSSRSSSNEGISSRLPLDAVPTTQIRKMRYSDEQWQNVNAWLRTCFKSPFEATQFTRVSNGPKVHALEIWKDHRGLWCA